MNILKLLTQSGLARSARGPRGGYALARPAAEITLTDVIRAIEGAVHLAPCINGQDDERPGAGENTCDVGASCPIRPSIHRLHDRLIQFLDEVTLADMVRSPARPTDEPAGPTCPPAEA